jgi:rod shape-determining protein MreD
MRLLILSIWVILGVVIQTTWLASLHLPVIPDLILIMTISYGLLRGPQPGLHFGIGAGFFVDLVSGNIVGVRALSKMMAGFAAGFMEKNIFKDSLVVPAIVVFVGTIVCELFNIVMLKAFKANYDIWYNLLVTILLLAFFNALLAPLIYHFMLRLERFLAERAK